MPAKAVSLKGKKTSAFPADVMIAVDTLNTANIGNDVDATNTRMFGLVRMYPANDHAK